MLGNVIFQRILLELDMGIMSFYYVLWFDKCTVAFMDLMNIVFKRYLDMFFIVFFDEILVIQGVKSIILVTSG